MAVAFLAIVFVLNFFISWANAWGVGVNWAETKYAGGWPRFMSWMGAIMSACGFTWCYLVIITVIAGASGHMPQKYVEAIFDLGYLAIIFPVLGSGLAITINSWTNFWRERTFGNGAVATWNTAVDVYNMYEAASAIPEALKGVGKIFDSDDDDDSGAGKLLTMLVVILVVFAVAGGILTTSLIIKSTASKYASERRKWHA
jgi:hypothetical protein